MDVGLEGAPPLYDEHGMAKAKPSQIVSEEEQKEKAIEETLQEREGLYRRLAKT